MYIMLSLGITMPGFKNIFSPPSQTMETHLANQEDDQSVFSFTSPESREPADFHTTDLTSDMSFYPNTIKPLFAPNVSQELSTIPCTVIDVASCDVISLSDFDLPNMGGEKFIGPKTFEEAHLASESILYEELPELRRIAREIVSSPLLSQKAERTLFFGQNEERRKRPRKNTVAKAVTEKSCKYIADNDNKLPPTTAYDGSQAINLKNDTNKNLQRIDGSTNLNSKAARKFQNPKSSTDVFVMLDSDKQATKGFQFSRDFTTGSISSSSKTQRQTKFSNLTVFSDLDLEMEANDYYKDNDCLQENFMNLGLEKQDFEELQNDENFTEKFADLYLERQADDDFQNMDSFTKNFTSLIPENQETKYQTAEGYTNNFEDSSKEYQNGKELKTKASVTDDFGTVHQEKKAIYSFPNSDTFTNYSSTLPLHYNVNTSQDSNYNDVSRPKSFGFIENALKTDLNQESFTKTAPFSDPPTPTQQPAHYSYNGLGQTDLHSYPDQSLFSQTYQKVPRSTSNYSHNSQISDFSQISANVLAVNSQAHTQALNAAQKDLAVYTNSSAPAVFDSHLFISNSLNRTGSYKNTFCDGNGYNDPSVLSNPYIMSALPKVDINRMASRNTLITTTTTTTTIIQGPLLSTSNKSFNGIGQHNAFGLMGAIDLENLGSQEPGISSISDTLNFIDSNNDTRFNSHNATTNNVDQVISKQQIQLAEGEGSDYQHFIKERINHEIDGLNARRDDSMSSNSIQPSLISVVSKPSVSSNDQVSRTNESNSNISQNTQSSKHSEVSKYSKNVNYLQQAQYLQPHSASLSSLVSGISNLVVDIGQLSSPEQPSELENKIKDSVSIKSFNESVESSGHSTSLRNSISESSEDDSITSQDRYQRQHFILIPCNQNPVVGHSRRLSEFSFWSYESTDNFDNPESLVFKPASNADQLSCDYSEKHDSDAKSCTRSVISLESLNKPLPMLPEPENSDEKTQQKVNPLGNLKQSGIENGVDTGRRLQSSVIPKGRVGDENGEQNIGLKAILSQKQPATTFEIINFNPQSWLPKLETMKASTYPNRTSYVSNNYLNVIGLEDDDNEDLIRDLGLVNCTQPNSSPKITRHNDQKHNNEFQLGDISKPNNIDQCERDTVTHPEIGNISTSLYTDVKKPFNECIESRKLTSFPSTHPSRISTGYLFHVPSVYSRHIPHPSLQPSTLDSTKLAIFATKTPETDSSPRFSFQKSKRLSRVENLSKLFSHKTKLPSNSSQRSLEDIDKDSKELTNVSTEFENDVEMMVGGLNYLNELGKTMSNESEKLTKTKVKDFFENIYKTQNTRENHEVILDLDHKKPAKAQNKMGLKTNRRVLRKDSKVVKNRNRPNWQQARLFKDLNFSAKKEGISLKPKGNLEEMEKDSSSSSLVSNTKTQVQVEQDSTMDNNCNKNKNSVFLQSNSSRRSYGHTHHLHFSGYPPMRPHVLSCAVSPRQSASSADALPFKPLVPEHMYSDQLPNIWKHSKSKISEKNSASDRPTSSFKSKFKTMMKKINLKKV